MQVLYPLKFKPIFKERIWGGRTLEVMYKKALPPAVPIGESWEISDRPGDVSVVANGPLAGRDLHSLVGSHTTELLGTAGLSQARFPLLVKILDCREKLSLQVHPPAEKARLLGGEPKTEMWYVAQAEMGAELYVGLKAGTSQAQFNEQLGKGTVDQCFHRLQVRAGDSMFLPSGRVHAIGAGLVIFEIQQNSDTTYRVFDWNRVGPGGVQRQLHVPESLASIDFQDFEPKLVVPQRTLDPYCRRLVSDRLFTVDLFELEPGAHVDLESGCMHILGVVGGAVTVRGGPEPVSLLAGEFCLCPASLDRGALEAAVSATVLRALLGC